MKLPMKLVLLSLAVFVTFATQAFAEPDPYAEKMLSILGYKVKSTE